MSNPMNDEQLLRRLAAAFDAADPLPEAVVAAAKASFTWRTIDAELAALVFDSAAEELVGVRSAAATRQMTFRTPGVEIELALATEPNRRLIGQLVPPQTAEVELHHEDGVWTAQADSLGRFSLQDVPTGSVRLTCRLTDASATVQTEWMII